MLVGLGIFTVIFKNSTNKLAPTRLDTIELTQRAKLEMGARYHVNAHAFATRAGPRGILDEGGHKD